jgi:Ca2+-binding RTX toxin-like protein
MKGGASNDTYIVDNIGDVITEAANGGTDTVYSSVTYTLGSNIENLTLTGTSAINGTGNTLSNILTGNSGDNTLSGGTGADTMLGGIGNDTYIVDNVGDVVTENIDEGTDLVQSSVSYTLAANVENLTLTGTSAINGTGNELDNVLTGNTAANTLNGGSGADTMIGGTGNDIYIVDNIGDVVIENANDGTDTVQSSITYTLGANVENLTLTGTDAINGTGNDLNNVLTGNGAGNILDGGAGADTMKGGASNDTYIVDNIGDVITEAANGGTDTVYSSVTYTLGSYIENLTLTGTSAINGTGNTLSNILTGNSAVNTLTGNAANDTLDGAAGNDVLTGGSGSDTYLFRRIDGQDVLNETAGVSGDIDTLKLTDGITTTDPVIVKQNKDLYVFINADNYVKIAAEFQATNYGIERLEVSDGHYITRQDIQTIVDTMSSINNNAGMDVMQKYTAMMADQQYQNILASSWHQ